MSEADARAVFGTYARPIVGAALAVASGEAENRPSDVSENEYLRALERFGRNGLAVLLYLRSWSEVPWRLNEGKPTPQDSEVLRVCSYEEALNPTASETWKAAMESAGYRGNGQSRHAWDDGFEVGHEAGGHHAGFLAAGGAGELAQIPKYNFHFFLDCMSWVRAGHWPCGWADSSQRLIVF